MCTPPVVIDAKRVEQSKDSFAMASDAVISLERRVASSKSQQIDDDDSVACGQLRDDIEPEMAGCREAVYEYDGLAASPASSGVVIDPFARDIDEFTAHAGNIRAQVVSFQGLTVVPLANRVKLGILTRLLTAFSLTLQ